MDIDDDLVESVLIASRALVAIASISLSAAPFEVTLAQYRALVVLHREGSMRMSALAEACRLSPSSTTRLTERLERKGLVERRPATDSRRAVELDLTSAGSHLVEVVMEARRVELRRVLEQVPPEQRAGVRQGFEAFARASGERSAVPAPG